MNPPKMEPPRANCIVEGNNLLGKPIILDESEEIILKTEETNGESRTATRVLIFMILRLYGFSISPLYET